ncbi:YiiX family permuted papain-like enzyme [Candidatus Sumerlaeota bacterium]|nr:YiiX family permuted papain-like enzyme [Candidatus Sumerlaeota bacterium]
MIKLRSCLFLMIVLIGCAAQENYAPQNGDIIFHTSTSSQSKAIQLATNSPYSHMGIVYIQDGKPFVFEAVQPVKSTPLAEWIERGEGNHFVVKRLKDASERLTPDILKRMKSAGDTIAGKDYDLYFEWSDNRIYCSELVWKVYDRAADIQLGELQTISEFDLSHPIVAAKIKERFNGSIPADETVISPAAIFNSPELITFYQQ